MAPSRHQTWELNSAPKSQHRWLRVASDPDRTSEITDELADIVIYLVHLADILDSDLNEAVAAKLSANAEKYPVDRAKGSAAKYTEYGP